MLKTAGMAAASGNTGACEEQASLSRASVGTAAVNDVRELLDLVNSLLIEVHSLGDAFARMKDRRVVPSTECLPDRLK